VTNPENPADIDVRRPPLIVGRAGFTHWTKLDEIKVAAGSGESLAMTKFPSRYAMSRKLSVEVPPRFSQSEPFGEVKIVPTTPTATKVSAMYLTLVNVLVVTESCGIQVSPSGDSRIEPSTPTATYVPFPNVIEYSLLLLVGIGPDQTSPSIDW
jgi:hypothetical protein